MRARAVRDAPAARALTASETHLLDRVLTSPPNTLNWRSYCPAKIAGLERNIARTSNSPPGNLVIWHGLPRLRDVETDGNIPPRFRVIERIIEGSRRRDGALRYNRAIELPASPHQEAQLLTEEIQSPRASDGARSPRTQSSRHSG
jgi:hypothetical protein